ncbi:MAG TPA: DUF1345 domain-containing protein [Stellaceae bacterium]|nr:DUF1345 domain-containing protein [Stellaceae bacterium]
MGKFRPRLLLAVAIGVAAALLAPPPLHALRAVIGWDCAALVHLVLTLAMAGRATPESMRRRAAREDMTRWLFLVLMAAAAFFAMFAILGPVHQAKSAPGGLSLGLILLGGATIILSWLFAHIAFAVHYAHEYFADRGPRHEAGLIFPGRNRQPDYWDFLYFSFVIGMTCQVSDVQVATQSWRRLVLVHGVFSFLFNTVVLALSINLVAGLL